MTRVKAAIYRDRQVVKFLGGIGITKTTTEYLDGDLDDEGIRALKRLLEGGRKSAK